MSDRRRVLDEHGYLELVESWGSDEGVIAAARMSTGKGFRGWGPVTKCDNCGDTFDAPERECPNPSGTRPLVDCGRGGHYFTDQPGDEKLLAYLWRNGHSTPFETPGFTVEVGCPCVVVWQWVRHRTMSYNILSGRYAEMPTEDYLPTVRRCLAHGGGNKQAGAADGAAVLTEEAASAWLDRLSALQRQCAQVYGAGLVAGVPKELARLALTFARHTRMRVTANLWNWLRFLKLRRDEHAQREIRLYADAVAEVVWELYPRTWRLFAGG